LFVHTQNALLARALWALGAGVVSSLALAVNAAFARHLERSGCTPMSEQQGRDIRKTRSEHVWVNGKRVKAKRSGGGLAFQSGTIASRTPGDRRPEGEDTWTDRDAGTQGAIVAQQAGWLDRVGSAIQGMPSFGRRVLCAAMSAKCSRSLWAPAALGPLSRSVTKVALIRSKAR
jgi:hypothetical protein